VAPEAVAERNWFFRLGRYQDEIVRLVARDELRIRPAHRKREVLAFLEEPLRDLSISRSVERARGWGIPVPGDSAQIVYVWFDALANYVSALDYATSGARLERYWSRADRVSHVIGKGVTRFHAVYWPAILLSAGLRPPTELLVHGYVTVDGEKIGKSLGNTIAPAAACSELGVDALRYYLLRHVGTHRDGDFSWQRLREVYAGELANGLGNLLARATALVRRHGVPEPRPSRLAAGLEDEVRSYISEFALHRGLDAIWAVVAAANAHVNETEPWTLAKRGEHEALAAVLAELYAALRSIGAALAPFLPDTSTRLLDALAGSCAVQLFPRVAPRA
jgi:methionyl-tRNA synthetase